MILHQQNLRILLVGKKEDNLDEEQLPLKIQGYGVERRSCSMDIVRSLASNWEPDLIVFGKSIWPGQVCIFATWLAEEPCSQKPYIISRYVLRTKLSRKLRKSYRTCIREFQRRVVLTFTKFAHTLT